MDTIVTYLLAKYLDNAITDHKVVDFHGDRDRFYFVFDNGALEFVRNGDMSSICFRDSFPKKGIIRWNPGIKGCLCSGVDTVANDRIIEFALDCEQNSRKMVIELTGRRSNIIICDKNSVIETALIKIGHSKSSLRQILSNANYKPPPKMKRICPFVADVPTLKRWIETPEFGIKESTVRDIQFFEWILSTVESDDLNVSEVIEMISSGFLPMSFDVNTNRLIAVPIDGCEMFDNHSDGFRRFCDAVGEGVESIDLTLFIKRRETLRNRIESLQKQLDEWKAPEFYRKIGNNISANIFRLSKGMDTAVLDDIYDQSGTITIKLDRILSPGENAAHYYDLAHKADRARRQLPAMIDKINIELKRVESAISGANERTPLFNEVARELEFKEKKATHKLPKKVDNAKYRTFEFDNHKVYVGKNSAGNDYVTLRLAKPWDIWLHARGTPGAHVVIKLENKTSEPSQKLLIYAAGLAAFYSNQRHEEYAEVIYTQRRWVQKVRKYAGMVKLIKEKTITIKTPSEKQLRISQRDI